MEVKTIGLDLAKHIFQVHGVDAAGEVRITKRLRRNQLLEFFAGLRPCLVGVEACPTAHYWGRKLKSLGHDVRLIPPQYVKPYVRRSKNDAMDAAAICEAVARPSMRFVPIKGPEQQAALMLHRTRDLIVRQRTQLLNAFRSHAAEFGVIAPKGPQNVATLLAACEEARLPVLALELLRVLHRQIDEADARIEEIETQISAWHKANEVCRRLSSVPGIGPLTATAIAATVPDPGVFKSGREFAAWLGLTPRQNSSGGKDRLGRITRKGNQHVRRLLIIGAHAALLNSRVLKATDWVQGMMQRRPRQVVAVALANKMARIAWALMARGTSYKVAAAA
jgi:transposase